MSAIRESEKTIFGNALRMRAGGERAEYLDHACQGDERLRAEVEELLAAHDRAGNFLGGPAPAAALDRPPDEAPGTVIGRYKLLDEIGDGGMGVVYKAEQLEPVRRLVALKIIKPGMDTRRVVARFEAERQTLALLDHPNIAKVYDAGQTESGRSYFVMELVDGVPLTDYCDQNKLTTRQRLELFAHVCLAVQHAHQKGIIHRDLKPSNVLVAVYDGAAVPKVIDFGVAKALNREPGDAALTTGLSLVIGTPLYMSPEQAGTGGLDVDTRSDIYSLGVMLYELLTGSTPFDSQRVQKAAYDEIRRMIREEEPPLPSSRISTLDGTSATVAMSRKTEPAQLTKLLRGDLDWIVMKTLEKDRVRRYETVNGFAADIERYLVGDPVLAAPPTAGYKLRKFVRKHRAALTTAAAIALVTLTGTAVSICQAVRATRAEGAALAAQSKAEERTQIARAIQDFLQNKLLRQADMEVQIGDLLASGRSAAEAKPNPTILQLLDRAATELTPETINANFPNKPLVQAEILRTVGRAYFGIAEYGRAIGFLQRAADLYTDNLGPTDPNTLKCRVALAASYRGSGKPELAVPLSEQMLKLYKEKLGAESSEALLAMNNLASAYEDSGNFDSALPLFNETLKLSTDKLGPNDPSTLRTKCNLVIAYREAGKPDLAVPLGEETLKQCKTQLRPGDLITLSTMNNLAIAYGVSGKLDRAVPLFEEVLKLRKSKLDPDDPETLRSMGNLANAYRATGKLELALPLYEETLKHCKTKLGNDHPDTIKTMNNLVNAYHACGKPDRAVPHLEEIVRIYRIKPGVDHQTTLNSMSFLANLYCEVGRLDLALPLYEETVKRCGANAKLGPDHFFTIATLANLAQAYQYAGKADESLARTEELVARAERHRPDGNPAVPDVVNRAAWRLANSPGGSERSKKLAVRAARQAVALVPENADNQQTLGVALFRTGDWKGAVAALEKSQQLRAGGDASDWFVLAMAHWQLGEKDKARADFDKAIKWMDKNVLKDEDLPRFRAEAAKLLGIEPKAVPAKDVKPGKAQVPQTANEKQVKR